MAKEKEKNQKSCKHGRFQRQTGGHACKHEYTGTGPRGERPCSLSSVKKKK